MADRQHEMSDGCWCRPCKVRYNAKGEMVDICHSENCDCDL